ncbi:hypothetical protein C8Q75DRAFT_586396 [Abortiporus biennis]|nr:hypothetical protein C8Q75DRAFT_586396 [Abortiporus biennis]
MRSRIIAYTLLVFAAVALPALAVPHPQNQQRNNQAHASAPSPNLQETTGISHVEGTASVHPEQVGSTLQSSTHHTIHAAQSHRKVALLEQFEPQSSLRLPTVHEPLRSTNSRDAQSRKTKLTTPHHSLHTSSRTLLPEVQEQSERNLQANHVAANSRTPTIHKNSLQRPITTNFYSTDRRVSHLRHKVTHHKHSQLHAIDDESGTSGSRWHPTNKVAHLEQPERTSLLRQSLRPFNQKVSYIKLGNNEDAVRGSSSSFTRIPNPSSHSKF